MKKIGIIGGAGYAAGELIRLLLHHPEAELGWIHSRSQAGRPVASVHEDLLGECDLLFTGRTDQPADILFLGLGHGEAKKFLADQDLPAGALVIDLSQDFRWADGWVYGLPELNGEAIRHSRRIANPGCFATALQLALLPLAQAGLLDETHIHAVTGATGAGQSLSPTSHFSWRNNNLSIYKPFGHQHLREIRRSLQCLQPDFAADLNFLPLRGDFTRGIFASLYTRSSLTEADAYQLYQAFYQEAPFVVISPDNPSLKQTINTNKCILHLEKHGDKLLIVSLIDNLLKGAAGQAVQNMNLVMGWE